MPHEIIIGDGLYVVTEAYRQGALAMRRQVPNKCNPHRYGTQRHDDWDYGHQHESEGEHVRFGIDVIMAPARPALCFEQDPAVPRDASAGVDGAWYGRALAATAAPGYVQPVDDFLRQHGYVLVEDNRGIMLTHGLGDVGAPPFGDGLAARQWVMGRRPALLRSAEAWRAAALRARAA